MGRTRMTRTDGRTDGLTDGRTDGRTRRRLYAPPKIFGEHKKKIVNKKKVMPTDRRPNFFGDVSGNKEHFFTPYTRVKKTLVYKRFATTAP